MSEAKLDKAIRDEERWAWEGLCSVCDQAMRPNDDGFPPDSEEQAICNNCIWDERDRLKQELATLRAQVLPEAVVKAVRAYQAEVKRWHITMELVGNTELDRLGRGVLRAIEADAKEREG